jgi:intracellular multiplication protein IcmO
MPAPNKTFRGVEGTQEVRSKDVARDTRARGVRWAEKLQRADNLLMVMGLIALAPFFFPLFTEASLLVGIGLLLWLGKRPFALPFRMPKTSGLMDPNDLHPANNKPMKADGIAFVGNELNSRREVWFKNDDMRTHLLVFGSTGAGKTEALVSIAFNALVQGSGFIYVDGKGDSSLFAKIFSMARAVGREDDVLVINYMTGSRDVFGPQATKLSNTMNPFSSGSSGGLTELLVSLMDESGGDNAMWKGRAISLISALMMALVHMREQKQILLDVEEIRKTLVLEEIIKLGRQRDLPPHVATSIKSYLRSLPGYQESNDPNAKQSETVLDQHGYLQMQFTRILGSLADSYGYIFKTNLGEVDFWDVVVQRRILVVLLPALEKSPEELANLGKIIVASLKQMMSTGLGAELEGLKTEILDSKPTVSKTPFMCILDEYGYYAVKGAAVMPAQARSLGFCMVFAGQDYPAFEKASKEEAASTIANCNIKIFMKLEDPKDTYDLFAKSLGETYVAQMSGWELQNGGYAGNKTAGIEKRMRGDLRDLQEQAPGEAHVIFKGGLVRMKMFYAAPKNAERYQLNYFLKVEPPEKIDIEEMDKGLSDLREKLLDETFMTDIEDSTDPVQDIELIRQAFEEHSSLSLMEQGAVAVAAHQISLASQIEAFRRQMGQMMETEEEDESSISIFRPPREEREAKERARQEKDKASVRSGGSSYGRSRAEEPEEREYDDYDATEEADGPLFLDEQATGENLERLEQLGGETPEAARANSARLVEDMKAVSAYPRQGAEPETKTSDDILEMLKELEDQMDNLERGDEEDHSDY